MFFIHARRLLEDCLRLDLATGVWAFIDVDFVNAFPRFEWGAVDAAMAAQLTELAVWTRWCHEDVDLPSGDVHRARLGAEQGDPHGSCIPLLKRWPDGRASRVVFFLVL